MREVASAVARMRFDTAAPQMQIDFGAKKLPIDGAVVKEAFRHVLGDNARPRDLRGRTMRERRSIRP